MSTTRVTSCLTFNNQAEEALNFYKKIFNGLIIKDIKKIDSPKGGLFLSAKIELLGQEIILLNGGENFFFSAGFSLFVHCERQEDVDTYRESFVNKGSKEMSCGWIIDPFGICWQIVPKEMGQYLFNKDYPEKAHYKQC